VIIVKAIEGSLWKGDCMMLWKVEQSFEEKINLWSVGVKSVGMGSAKMFSYL
jgi:hypothetical protein